MKTPIPFVICSSSMFVPHDAAANDALQQSVTDYGLKPNGLKIEDLRDNIELYSTADELDRLGVAQRVSGSLANDIKRVAQSFISSSGSLQVKPFKIN